MSTERETSAATRNYPSGRCRAISRAARRRCQNSAGHGANGTLCSTHAHENDSVTIDSDPRTLIQTVSEAYPARCRAIEHTGGRCTTGCGPTDRFCALHQTIPVGEVTGSLDEGELDVALIKQALSAVTEPRVATDGGFETRTFRVEEGRTVAYGPAGPETDDWELRFTSEDGERVGVRLDGDAMYALWTEVHNVPWANREDDRHDLQREVVALAEGASAERLRDVLAVLRGEDR